MRSWSHLAAMLASLIVPACRTGAPLGPGQAGDDGASPGPGGRGDAESAEGGDSGAPPSPAACPATEPAPSPLPGIEERQRTAAYWVERAASYGDVDAPLLTPSDVENHGRALRLPVDGRPLGWTDLLAPVDRDDLLAETNERIAAVREKVESGEYADVDGRTLGEGTLEALRAADALPPPANETRVALGRIQIRCAPTAEGLYTVPPDPDFDRNDCSSARPQEVLQVLAGWPGGLLMVRAASVLGWIAADAPLSPPVPRDLLETLARSPRVRVVGETSLRSAGGAAVTVPDGTLLAPAPGDGPRVYFATAEGIHASEPLEPPPLPTRRDLTRRALIEEAFARLDAPYGWGGHEGGLDCSGFLQDVFASFGVELPRHSGRQALAGSFAIDVEDVDDPREKLRLIEAAAARGAVLLQMSGHIMLYLGLAEDGTPMAIHAFSEYLTPCERPGPGGASGETRRRVDRVDVSDLSLGLGTSRRSFLERIERVALFGERAGEGLAGVARPRAAAPVDVPSAGACADSLDVAVFRSPRRPTSRGTMRVVVTSVRDPGPVELVLVDPGGQRIAPEPRRLGGPPYAWWVEVDRPAAGEWTAVLGDGSRVEACERFGVARNPSRPALLPVGAPPWKPLWAWERDTEALYAAFVEQLFRAPEREEVTWPDLQTLLADPQRNLLLDHLGLGEDERIRLVPDCADLPFFLRAYFAWKLRLPFAFRQCTRGRAGVPPTCADVPFSNVDVEEEQDDERGDYDHDYDHDRGLAEGEDEVEVFERFITRVANMVHSATARTLPAAEAADLYPVPLEREALAPGTVFADPYGHVLVVAAWLPQGTAGYGILLGAEAQPDGTVGRRQFWQGSFLFTPETTEVGAGFKAWRPAVYRPRDGAIETIGNDALRTSTDHARWSDDQYAGTAGDFYDRMEALINPRPLDPQENLRSLVDALEEAVVRRAVSVDGGEEWAAAHPDSIAPMPEGYDVFETEGPWEDYATPSRDMRLLIAIDTVLGFPDAVARRPDRFGVAPGVQAEAAVADLRDRLERDLASRSFSYTRSDGSAESLTLDDVVDRSAGFEVAYNPNDCVEVRWAAPEGSDERSTCRRRAPEDQRRRMEEYRSWFHERRRPPR